LLTDAKSIFGAASKKSHLIPRPDSDLNTTKQIFSRQSFIPLQYEIYNLLYSVISSSRMDRLTVLSLQLYLGLLTTFLIFAAVKFYRRRPRIPTNVCILKISTLSGKDGETADIEAYQQNGSEVMQQGYELYSRKGQNFLMRTSQGLVFVAAPRFIEEIRTAPDSELSGMTINNGTLQVKYTLHYNLHYDWYEFDVVGKQLTQNLGKDCHLKGY
jgi:hypothetical protein